MENILNANIRTNKSKGEKNRLRKAGKVPGIIYGHEIDNTLLVLDESDLTAILKKTGEYGVVNLKLNNKNEKAFIKEVQRNPMTNKITHIDFMKVDETEKIRTKIPVRVVGEEKLKNLEIMAQLQMPEVEVEGMADKLPKFIEANVSKFTYGDRLILQDVEVAEEISIIGDLTQIVAVAVSSRYVEANALEIEDERYGDPMIVHADNMGD